MQSLGWVGHIKLQAPRLAGSAAPALNPSTPDICPASLPRLACNTAHEGLARLQASGWVGHIISQNVDRLHHKAGSAPSRVLELHGTTHRVICMGCGHESCRHELQVGGVQETARHAAGPQA